MNMIVENLGIVLFAWIVGASAVASMFLASDSEDRRGRPA
jgi:hypothetical protein